MREKGFMIFIIMATFICLIYISGTSAQKSLYTYDPGYGYMAGSSYVGYGSPYDYKGYTGYSYPGSFYGGGYPRYDIPRGIMESMAYSGYAPYDPDIAQLGYKLSIPYFRSDLMSGWTPWRPSSYATVYTTTPGGYNLLTSKPYYSSPASLFTSSYPTFTPSSSRYPWSAPYSTKSYSNSKTNTIVTVTGRVVGSYLLNSNGREMRCYAHLPQQAVFDPLDLSPYMGEIVEVSGYLIDQDLYGASFERVIE